MNICEKSNVSVIDQLFHDYVSPHLRDKTSGIPCDNLSPSLQENPTSPLFEEIHNKQIMSAKASAFSIDSIIRKRTIHPKTDDLDSHCPRSNVAFVCFSFRFHDFFFPFWFFYVFINQKNPSRIFQNTICLIYY